ncbi:hypothetical protein [Clostridium estertheticum]|nr:hypothetical protein [Clostridium estertheticum]
MTDRQETTESALKVYSRLLPILLKRMSKIKDPRQTKRYSEIHEK